MKPWNDIEEELNGWLAQGLKGPIAVVNLANACIGYPYVFGSWGERCTPSNRKSRARDDKPTIISKCQVLNPDSNKAMCGGCRWYPDGTTLSFDCRGFTYFVLNKGAGIKISGSGATSQYNNDANWSEKGLIANMPRDKVCCVFRYDRSTKKMEHTLLYDGQGNYIHCSGEVKKCKTSQYAATHYAIPKGLYDGVNPDQPMPIPTPGPEPKQNEAIITGKNVAMRKEPAEKAGLIMRIPTNTIVNIASETDEWQVISYGGTIGYMMKEFLKEDADGTKAVVNSNKSVNFRTGPGKSYTSMKQLKNNTVVNIVKATDEWQLITHKGKTGYMMRQFIKEAT